MIVPIARVVGSGRAGCGGCRPGRFGCRYWLGRRHLGRKETGRENRVAKVDAVSAVLGDPVAVGVVFQKDAFQFPPQRIRGEDAEGEADLGEDLTDRAIAELGGDFLRCGKGDGGVGVRVIARLGRGAGAAFALGRRGLGGLFPLGPGERGVEGGGEAQAAGDAGEDEGDVLGGETHGDPEDGHAGGPAGEVPGQVFGVGDELAEDVAQAGRAGGRVRLILAGIGRLGERGGAGRGGHGGM